jgi:hypothetical protein
VILLKKLEDAKKIYQSIEAPPSFSEMIGESFEGSHKRKRRWYKPALCTAATVCILFVGLLNCSSVFAQSLAAVPVLGNLARVFTFRDYTILDSTRQISVEQPKLSNTGNAALEEQINKEINAKVKAAIAEAEKRTEEDKKAYVETGGDPKDFIPAIVDVNYEVKCSNEKLLSFVLNTTQTQANAYTEQTFYNIDLKSGKELTLTDLLGKDCKKLVDESVRRQIKERAAKDPESIFFEEGDGGFSGITDKQNFYINKAGHVVVVFNKYEIAPGCMGIQEFEIVK